MPVVYPPHPSGEIGVVGRDLLCHAAAQQREIVRGWGLRQWNLCWRIVLEARLVADVTLFMDAFQPETAALPGKQRLAGQQRRRGAARRDELHLRHQHPPRVLLAEQDGSLHHRVHERRAERAGEAAPFGAHQVDAAFAVDLRAAEEEHIDAPLPGEVEQLARALGERVAFSAVKERYPQRRIFLL
jgi:hypothetical protein